MPRSPIVESQAVDDRRNRNSAEQKDAVCHQSLIDELEASISQRNIGSRAEILGQITDLFQPVPATLTASKWHYSTMS